MKQTDLNTDTIKILSLNSGVTAIIVVNNSRYKVAFYWNSKGKLVITTCYCVSSENNSTTAQISNFIEQNRDHFENLLTKYKSFLFNSEPYLSDPTGSEKYINFINRLAY